MTRVKALIAAASALAALTIGTTGVGTASAEAVRAQEARTVCYANDVDVRYTVGGSPTGRLVYLNQSVNVIDHRDGVWWQINSPYSGYVLAQYFC
ncbi:hypothetical protein ABZ816_23585 [Actinosynnema sp. NPDC047251]|uniref:SH3b domain-containing protein n=1 Tax=Saccharothrix espanaensis (strain ATCC 51144 / DSM 44229 / JCM 9112 / NBRC 15066 / NRRL 15764) TaxID=1179773 RepID=K0K7G1_SACES|nr:hypothetical protein [Saccharothrix espanaensis]CCH32548.1 hypothetical protein BN6_52840 [Saccharothrix espanaensis DSM 44229]